MDFKKILVELDKNISKTYSAESLSTESAMTAIVASNATSLNEDEVKKVEKIFLLLFQLELYFLLLLHFLKLQ